MKVGIIGCGKITEVRHAPEYQENPHCEIAGFYDVVPEKAQALAKGLQALGIGIDLDQVQTNVVRLDVSTVGMDAQGFCASLENFGVKAKPVGPTYVRMICHKDLTHEMVPTVLQAVERCIQAPKAG